MPVLMCFCLFCLFLISYLQVFSSLLKSTEEIKGATVENNKFCVSVHYRNVDEDVCFFFEHLNLEFSIHFSCVICHTKELFLF